MNQIDRIRFDFNMQNELFAQNLYGRWDSFFTRNFEEVADAVLAKYDFPDENVEIKLLQLDLGVFSEASFDEEFPIRLKTLFEEVLLQHLHNPFKENQAKRISQHIQVFEWLKYFLLNGILPWNISNEYKNISKLFNCVLDKNGNELKRFLYTYGHYTFLQERLVYQLNDPELEKGVYLIKSSDASFICSYIHLLHIKYKEIQSIEIQENIYHNVVWLVVYAYLLNNRSSYFNKKSFVMQTILQLATRNNLSYDWLLNIVSRELTGISDLRITSSELYKILNELRKELSQKQIGRSAIHTAEFYQTIAGLFQKKIREGINDNVRESLNIILVNPDSCRFFLQRLNETEIIRLVPVIIFNKGDSDFIIRTAQSLDKIRRKKSASTPSFSIQKIQGKMGGEFRLLKWQIIFPILLENKGATFNRKYFVKGVLKQIAAHYNLYFNDLLNYILGTEVYLSLLDRPLQQIIKELYLEEYTKNTSGNESGKPGKGVMNVFFNWNDPGFDKQNFLSFIYKTGKLSSEETPQLKHFLESDSFLAKILDLINETECNRLVHLITPGESRFIISYAGNLDCLNDYGILQGRVGNGFQQIKWKFIFGFLSSIPDQSFNRSHFVRRILQQISAHYNLAYIDLLAYFQTEDVALCLPFQLQALLTDLFREEKEHWVKISLNNPNDPVRFRLLKIYVTGEEEPFIRSYIRALDYYQDKGMLQGKVSGNFRDIKWRFIFEVLFESQNTAFNKKQFVSRSLLKIAGHYNLSLSELLSYLSIEINHSPQYRWKEINALIFELYAELTDKNQPDETSHNISNRIKRSSSPPLFRSEQWIRESFGRLTENERDILDRLLNKKEFIAYTEDILQWISYLRKQLTREFNISLDNSQLLNLLLQLSRTYKSLSRINILNRILEWTQRQLTTGQKEKMNQQLMQWAKKNNSIHIYKQLNLKIMKTKDEMSAEKWEISNEMENLLPMNEVESSQLLTLESQFINNAGLVLLTPFIPVLFNRLQLIGNDRQFKDDDSRVRAMFVLQFAVFEKTEFPEHEMTLNKLLTGYETRQPIPQNLELTDNEKEMTNSMLDGIRNHWQKMRNTSNEGLRQGFLQRGGKLEEQDDRFILTVDPKAYDMLLDSLPWSYSPIRFSWIKKMIRVKWRN